jgi:hypothetical protein
LSASVGEEGFGPGEYQYILDVFPTGDGGFSTVDMRLRRWTLYDATGDLIRTQALDGPLTKSVYSDSERALYVGLRTRSQRGTCLITVIHRWPMDEAREDGVALTPFSDAPLGRASGCPVDVESLAALPNGGFAVAFGRDEYVVRGFDAEGAERFTTIHSVPRVPRTEEELEAERGRIRRIAGSVIMDPDPYRSHFMGTSLRADSAGRMWIRTERGVGSGTTIFDIFSEDGEFLREVTLPLEVKSPGAGFDVAGDYLVTVHVDEATASELVTLWRISWSQ